MEDIRVESPTNLSLRFLPPEIRRLILSHLPDLRALREAILSHSCLNGVFASNKAYIVKSVVISYVSPELLPVALSVFESSRIEPWTREKVFDLLDRHHSPYVCPPYQINIQDALCLEKMHSHVSFFARRFAASALSKHPLTGDTESPSAMTANEWRRIAHNFYLFELYAELFRKRDKRRDKNNKSSPDFSFDEHQDLNEKRHSFWEIEQQTCIYEYLFRELSKVYNDTATHDVKWGVYGSEEEYADVEAWEYRLSPHKSYFLLCGLAFIRSFITADTFEERCRLIYSRPLKVPYQHPITFKWEIGYAHGNGAILKEYTPERVETELGPSFLPHLDHGPMEAWMWTHAAEIDLIFGYNYNTRKLRARGYVLWDIERLLNWGFFQSEWIPPDEDDGQDFLDREHAMWKARARKKQLAWMGVEGWWSKDDESQLTWDGYPLSD